jgi:hypothetical protein
VSGPLSGDDVYEELALFLLSPSGRSADYLQINSSEHLVTHLLNLHGRFRSRNSRQKMIHPPQRILMRQAKESSCTGGITMLLEPED